MPKRLGAVPSQAIRDMIAGGFIPGASTEMVQPASLDLTIGEETYRVRSAFRPRSGETVKCASRIVFPERHDLRTPLEVNVTYLIRLNERLALPEEIYGYANPKSSIGRNDIHVRMLSDGITRFDSAGIPGYRGSLWALVTPRSFRIKLNPGDSLLQVRFFNSDTRFSGEAELQIAYQRHQLLFTSEGDFLDYSKIRIRDRDGGLILTINLDEEMVGYRCEGSQEVLDLSKREHDPMDFFKPVGRPKDGLTLRRGDFYILATKEFLRVPPELAAEMMPVDIRAGEYRAQYAGYFDPGWGFGPEGALRGAPAVLEIRPFEDNFVIRDGEPICKMVFERMMEEPDTVYGGNGSHYLQQRGPRLSKHFRM